MIRQFDDFALVDGGGSQLAIAVGFPGNSTLTPSLRTLRLTYASPYLLPPGATATLGQLYQRTTGRAAYSAWAA